MFRKICISILTIGILFLNSMLFDNLVYGASTPRAEIKINGVNYKWMEKSYGGTNRGIMFNPGRHEYQFRPNPHDDPWYNKNQMKFYNEVALQVKSKGDAGKWTKDNWPATIKITVHNIPYTLE
ncbi:hypothetical protein [Bacillus sp. FSL K6-0067]|uniref:hypothetical protein n=1 Tax=Bacillus sp. FSL K6-0067 TaxID=2921412 RepID=UPI00077A64B8|nr:hypothetical protein [Bacillus cereus]KXY21465.1 hypothetical protein AT267_08915 [Bacillus cereus]